MKQSRTQRRASRQASIYGYRHYIKGKSHEVKGYEPAWMFPVLLALVIVFYIVLASQ